MWTSVVLLLAWLGAAVAQTAQAPGTCNAAQWTKAVFLKSPRDPKSFSQISDWQSAEYRDWVVHDLSKEWIPSAVFAGIALASLIIILAWRVFCNCCCCQSTVHKPLDQPHQGYADVEQQQAQHAARARRRSCGPINRTVLVLQVVIGVFVTAAFGLTIWGITSSKQGVAQQGWEHVDTTNAYVNLLATDVDQLLANISRVNQVVDELQTTARGLGLTTLDLVIQGSSNQIKATVNDIVNKYDDSAQEVRTMVVDRINDLKGNYYQPTTKWDSYRYKGVLAVFSVGLFILVVFCVAMLINCPALFTLSTIFIGLLAFLYLVMGLSLAFALAGGNDACPAVETIALSFMSKSPKVETMARYYFYNQGGNLTDVLAQAEIVDVRELDTLLLNLADVTSQLLQLVSTLNLSPNSIQNSLLNANSTMNDIITARNQLLTDASYTGFSGIYANSRSYVCCSVPDQFVQLWFACTIAGWIMLVMTWISCSLIYKYNKVPASDNKLGWVCLTEADTLPQLRLAALATPMTGTSETDSSPSTVDAAKVPAHYYPPVPGYGAPALAVAPSAPPATVAAVNIQMVEQPMVTQPQPARHQPYPSGLASGSYAWQQRPVAAAPVRLGPLARAHGNM